MIGMRPSSALTSLNAGFHQSSDIKPILAKRQRHADVIERAVCGNCLMILILERVDGTMLQSGA